MNHTPAPWTAHDDDGTGTLPCVLANQVTTFGNFYVAQCNVYDDAVLCAAAPDLLAALEGFAAAARRMRYCAIQCGIWEHDMDHAVDVAIDAIAKVKGEAT